MCDTVGLCFFTCWSEKEHKRRCRNTNLSLSSWLPAAQLCLWPKTSHPYSVGAQPWSGLLNCMNEMLLPPWTLNAFLPCQYAKCIVDTSGLEHRFHPTPRKQQLSPRCEAWRVQGGPCCPCHPHLCSLSCSWLEGNESSGRKPGLACT